jgi:hypothetical protein
MDRFEKTILIGPRIDTFIAQTFTGGISWLIVNRVISIPTTSPVRHHGEYPRNASV